METIGVLHPGDMGAAIAGSILATGRSACFASEGRSEATRQRGLDAGMRDVGSLRLLIEASDLLIAICPPSAALAQASQAIELGFDGIYLDANAVSRATALGIASVVSGGGCNFVDGAVIGSSEFTRERTRLFLAGDRASDVRAVFEPRQPDAIVLDGAPGTASALKMAYAAWTKGSAALLIAIRAFAASEGLEDRLIEQWVFNGRGLEARSTRSLEKASTHGWRWIGEMDEVAESFREAGLPDGFHVAAGRVFGAFPRREDEVVVPGAEVHRRLTGPTEA